MEVKTILLKKSNVDACPLCINGNSVDDFVQNIINLSKSIEDINL